jgi:hypothetical protein
MALFDTNQGGGLFDSLPNIFMTPDFSQTGILTPDQQKELRNQATKAGLLGSALTYFATPQTENYGSIVPYLAKAGLGGMGAAQDVYGSGLTNLYRQRLSTQRDDGFTNINPLDVTPESLKAYEDSIAQGKPDRSLLRRAAPAEKDTTDITNYNEARKGGYKGTFTDFLNIKKPQTNINMPAGQTKYDETLGTIRAKQDVDLVETANKSKNNISKIDMTLNQIQKSDAITGFGADIQKNVNRFKAKVLNDAKAGKQVADTEILDAFLGSDVFPQIGALGIGAKGLDTPAEREFLRQVMTGTISMDKNALIKMTQIRRDIEKRAIDRYNSAVETGELNDYFASTKRQKKLIDIPDNSGFRIVP